MTHPFACPLLPDMIQVRSNSHNLVKSIRKLRRKLSTCSECPQFENCPVLQEFNADIQATIAQITEEWSLDSLIP